MGVSPLTMSFMIAFRCSGAPAEVMRESWDSSAGHEARLWLLTNGLIDREDAMGRATEKGEVWLERALATPLPVCRWEFPASPDRGPP